MDLGPGRGAGVLMKGGDVGKRRIGPRREADSAPQGDRPDDGDAWRDGGISLGQMAGNAAIMGGAGLGRIVLPVFGTGSSANLSGKALRALKRGRSGQQVAHRAQA